MLTREDYQNGISIKQQLNKSVKEDPYRLGFHIMPPTGWLNDPNGLCQFKGCNHIYFQYTPFTPTWGMKLWGHYSTVDWISYIEEEPFLFADNKHDKDGVYSGSAFVNKDQIHYFYTGNVKYLDKDYDYINEGRGQNTLEVISKDGFTYQEKKLVLSNQDYPDDMSCHVRDPKVFEKEDAYYMVLGARSKKDKGCVLIYKSLDLKQWTYHMRIETETTFGYMWECPDLIEIDGKTLLICCPQGVATKGIQYQNIYQFGYFELNLDLNNKTYSISSFQELDYGFDIYAPQTFVDEKGRRILLAWMGIPDASYDNEPTVEKGWQHALTLPRRLSMVDGKLCQQPLIELEKLRKSERVCVVINHLTMELPTMFELKLSFKQCDTLNVQLRKGLYLTYKQNILTLKLEECGRGREERSVQISELNCLLIMMDTSSLEIFINDGEKVLTTRYYTQEVTPLKLEGNFESTLTLYEYNSFRIEELGDK